MNNSDLIFEDIRKVIERSQTPLLLSLSGTERLIKRIFLSAMYPKMDNQIDDHGPPNYGSSYKTSFSTYETAHFRPSFFPSTPFSAIKLSPIDMEGVSHIPPSVSDSTFLF